MVSPYTHFTLYGLLLHQARPGRPHIVSTLLMGLLASPLPLRAPVPLRIARNTVNPSQSVPSFIHVLLPATFTHFSTAVAGATLGFFVSLTLRRQLQDLVGWLLRAIDGRPFDQALAKGRRCSRGEELPAFSRRAVAELDRTSLAS